jgi:hypothetical protein
VKDRRLTSYYPLKGGINTEDPALSVKPGELLDALNYEAVTKGGYRRVDGYERFDGRPLPSTVVYNVIYFTAGDHELFLGDIILGATSQAHADIIDVVVESGSWVGGDAAGYFVFLYNLDGGTSPLFVDGEQLTTSTPEAFSTGFNSGYR